MSKYDKLVTEKERALKEEASRTKERQQLALDHLKKNREIGEKVLKEIVLPEFHELQQALQKAGMKVTLELNEPTIETLNRSVLVGVRLLVRDPHIVAGRHIYFALASGEEEISISMLVGQRPRTVNYEHPFAAITPAVVQKIVEDFIQGIYE